MSPLGGNHMGPSRASGGMLHSSSNQIHGNIYPNVAPFSSDISNNGMNSIGASSMVTNANSVHQNSNQDPNSHQMQKKPRLDIKPEDIMQHMLQRQDSMQLQNPIPQLQALIQQQRIRQQYQQKQMLQSLPPLQQANLLQQQQQLRQVQLLQPASLKRAHDGGVCSRRLMQYLYHQRQRPADNSIAYWRKFVSEYYSPHAKKRWCFSLYDNVGHHKLGVFPQATLDAWKCDICGSKSGKGFEATFEVLPRLNEIKFSSGVMDELLFLDLPRETRFPSGIMMLEYGKAVQESVYEQVRVCRQGQLKVIFTPDLKILTWEFCARHHEELLPRRLIAPQVNQLLQVAQKCQSTISDGVSQPDLQTNSNMVVTAWRQVARSLELQSINDLGFSKRYVRCLQISEVVSSMKDLMDFCQENKVGPIEGLKSYPRQVSSQMVNREALPHSALANYQNILMRQKLLNSNSQPESSPNGSIQGGGEAAQQHMNSNNGGGGGAKASISGQSGGGPTRSNSLSGGGGKPYLSGEDIVEDINGFFNNDDFEDTMGYDWKK